MDTNGNNKNLVPKPDSDLSIRSSYLARRGLELVSEISHRILLVPSQFHTIPEAIQAARDGDIIEISPGSYNVAATIDKSITIQASSGDVDLYPIEIPTNIQYRGKNGLLFNESIVPIITIINTKSTVIFRNLHFHGLSAGFFPPAISIKEGNIKISDCQFSEFNISFEAWGYLDSISKNGYQNINYAIELIGNPYRIEVSISQFHNCFSGISIENQNSIILRGCKFTDCDNGIHVSGDCSALISQNLFQGGGGIVLGRDSELISEYDTFFDVTNLISCASGCEARFYHASVKTRYILAVAFGKGDNLVEVDNTGNIVWEVPKLFFKDSILKMEYCDASNLFAASAFSMAYANKNVNIVESGILQLQNDNFVDCPPFFDDGNPEFNFIVENSVALKKSSSAIQAASDGTNLGAWQG